MGCCASTIARQTLSNDKDSLQHDLSHASTSQTKDDQENDEVPLLDTRGNHDSYVYESDVMTIKEAQTLVKLLDTMCCIPPALTLKIIVPYLNEHIQTDRYAYHVYSCNVCVI